LLSSSKLELGSKSFAWTSAEIAANEDKATNMKSLAEYN
jgi:hypothetical protein